MNSPSTDCFSAHEHAELVTGIDNTITVTRIKIVYKRIIFINVPLFNYDETITKNDSKKDGISR
ncbi:hypothetical protein J43TS3_01540 [Ornithinibacillus bavariensis]|uniref:Uncharacterized protein n=1 Tax=Ornithinibacillus bavariensis TaxID=545502 RepID=A0A920C5I0_9BACI|nr:hypothetical protein J43TS3_01540 [Ornithinibacillus bavariensis]